MNIGVLTGGGDCPGLNAVIRAVVRKAERDHSDRVFGFLDGFGGVLDDRWVSLDIEACRGILPRGGTIIGTSRVQPFMYPDGVDMVRGTLARNSIDGLNVVGVPKTIDNDIRETDLTFGFDTAVTIATEAIDRLHTTAESHHRVMVIEVMGRHVGHIATWSGIAGGAAMVLVPEEPFDIAEVCRALTKRHQSGRYASIVVVAEGARPRDGSMDMPAIEHDAFGHVRLGGIGNIVAGEIERRTGIETRVTILGHVQRGGTPTAYDRVISTWFGVAATEAVHDHAFGQMVALQGQRVVRVPLERAIKGLKTVDPDLLDVARIFFA
jgi:phosphofructokinase-like protein